MKRGRDPKVIAEDQSRSGQGHKPPKLLTAEEVAEMLRIKTKTVLDWGERGYLPCITLGPGSRKLVRFREDEILKLISESEQRGQEPNPTAPSANNGITSMGVLNELN